jgi:hypothetical protein
MLMQRMKEIRCEGNEKAAFYARVKIYARTSRAAHDDMNASGKNITQYF